MPVACFVVRMRHDTFLLLQEIMLWGKVKKRLFIGSEL